MNRLEQIIQNLINIDKKKILYEPYLKIISKSFNQEETPKHKKWKPLKEKRNKKILSQTGRLKQSFKITNKGITTNSSYAKYQQYGTKYITPRPFIPIKKIPQQILDRIIAEILK